MFNLNGKNFSLSKNISCREWMISGVTLLLSLLLAACSIPASTSIPATTELPANSTQTPPATKQLLPTATATLTAESTVTDTVIPKVAIEGVGDVSQPEAALFDQAMKDYRNAFSLDTNQPLTLTTASIQDVKDGKVMMALINTQDGTLMPVMMRKAGASWERVTIRALADMKDITIAAPLKPQYFDKPGYTEMIAENANRATLTEGIDSNVVFQNFTSDTWRSMLQNWEQVKTQLDQGVVPSGYDYNWVPSQQAVEVAKQHNMTIIAQHLLWPDDVPDSIWKSGFTKDELAKILEFTVKTKVLQYKGQIQEWEAEAEGVVAIKYVNVQDDYHARAGFWYRNLGGKDGTDVMLDVGRWAKQADPDVELRVVEDKIMELKFGTLQPDLGRKFFNLLERIKAENVPIDGVGLVNNFWIYSPPTEQHMIEVLQKIQSMGFRIATPETTVIISLDYPIWYENPPVQPIKVDNPLQAQADLYKSALQAYLKSGANDFGFGDISDQYSWYVYQGGTADAMIIDKSNRPKPAYYAVLGALYGYVAAK
jgi:endo-1,4-beta-xylanase